MVGLMRGRTSFVIAHRLYTITKADTIHVVEGGTIVESGSHTDLMARGGRYSQFFLARFGRETEPTGVKTAESIAAG